MTKDEVLMALVELEDLPGAARQVVADLRQQAIEALGLTERPKSKDEYIAELEARVAELENPKAKVGA